jgi:hypothetical protein
LPYGASNVTPGDRGFNAPYNPLVAKPPITISCECGEKRDVAYGERWQCEKCGRSWNTAQIPAEEYEQLLRSVRRHKLEALVAAAVSAAILAPLIIFVSASFIGLVPLAMVGWLVGFLPRWRRRYRRTARTAPRWQLHPE